MSANSYQTLITLELERYLASMDDACDTLREKPEHAPHYERTRMIHTLLKTAIELYTTDYLITGQNTFLTHKVTDNATLIKHPDRSTWERYITGIRSVLKRVERSYLLRSSFIATGLEWLAGNTVREACGNALQLLKYIEAICHTFETYMTWLEHGARLSMKYQNTTLIAETEPGATVELFTEDQLYTDMLVRAYAMLKTFDKDSRKAAELLDTVSLALKSVASLVGLSQKLYIKLPPPTVENILHTLVTTRQNKPTYTGTKFPNVHELNEKMRASVKESIEEPHGILYNIFELLETTRGTYVSQLASHICDSLVFLQTIEKQEQFIRDFETGKLWKNSK